MAQGKFTALVLKSNVASVLCVLAIFCTLTDAHGINHTSTLRAAEDAFIVHAQLEAGQGAPQLNVYFDIVPGHYLYRDKISFQSVNNAYRIADFTLAAGKPIYDEFFGHTEIYSDSWSMPITITLNDALKDVTHLEVSLQGCSVQPAVCYPPERRLVTIAPLQINTQDFVAVETRGNGVKRYLSLYTNQNALSDYLANASAWLVVPLFWFFGVLLSLTPCVLPMVPILGGILATQKQVSKQLLALLYVLGMSFAYSTAGVAAALLGNSLQAFLQHPTVLLLMATLLVVLALSMFDMFHLHAPTFWRDKIDAWQRRLTGGGKWQAFLLGALSAWVISPCVTPPLVGALIYIADSGDVYLGATALAALGLGMGLPLLLLGSAMSVVPRSGPWMVRIKWVFGVLILLSAALLVDRALPALGANDPTTKSSLSQSQLLHFEPIADAPSLKSVLAQSEGLVMHKLYADWCSSCLEMERNTFSDEALRATLDMHVARLLVSDVTDNNPAHRALMREYHLFGPPTLMFFLEGQEITDARVVGYVDAKRLLKLVETLSARP